MIQLVDVNEQNWLDVARLRVREDQRRFLDSAVGIIARGYAYRSCGAKVIGIADGGQLVGVALVKVFDEEPVWYDLQQFMIDERFQRKGYGGEALRLILAQLAREGKYPCVEVCVDKENKAALRLFERAGFANTGYVDETCPNLVSLAYHFPRKNG